MKYFKKFITLSIEKIQKERNKKKLSLSNHVHSYPIVWYERTLSHTYLFSFLIHLLIFIIFRVELTQVHDPITTIPIAEVGLLEPIPPGAVVSTYSFDEMHSRTITPLTILLEKKPYQSTYKPQPFNFPMSTLFLSPPEIKEPHLIEKEHLYPTPYTDKIPYYPVHLAFSKELKNIECIDDAAHLFSLSYIQGFLPDFDPITLRYRVKIGPNGTIVSFKQLHAFLDQRTYYAEKILQKLVFSNPKKKFIKGTITLTFFFDEQNLKTVFIGK